MKTIKNIIKTRNCNHYLHHTPENKAIYIHPLVDYFYRMEESGGDPGQWCGSLEGTDIEIDGLGVCSTHEIKYYFKKYRLFKEKGLFHSAREKDIFQRRLTQHDIENLLAGHKEALFEVTKNCNLDCRYCIQGDFYRIHEKHQNVNIDVEKAKRLLNYLSRFWSLPMSPRFIGIKFYGGEPLLNIDAIREIVDHAKSFTGSREKFYFKITTNGTLLHKHLDYLVENNFYIAVSLDGGENNNAHRVFKNGKPSYREVTANVELIRKHYPAYFEKNVAFQSVHHNLNSITGISGYFRENYGKKPSMADLTRVGLNEALKSQFDTLYASSYQSLYYGKDFPLLEEKKLTELPTTPGSGLLTHDAYNWLLKPGGEPGGSLKNKTPSGTCHPFSKGVFMATDGKILPCERIEHRYAFGYVGDEVVLDFKGIADRLNGYFENMKQLCLSCFRAVSCQKCIFYCDAEQKKPNCNVYCNQKEFLNRLAKDITFMENNPEIYYKHITEI